MRKGFTSVLWVIRLVLLVQSPSGLAQLPSDNEARQDCLWQHAHDSRPQFPASPAFAGDDATACTPSRGQGTHGPGRVDIRSARQDPRDVRVADDAKAFLSHNNGWQRAQALGKDPRLLDAAFVR